MQALVALVVLLNTALAAPINTTALAAPINSTAWAVPLNTTTPSLASSNDYEHRRNRTTIPYNPNSKDIRISPTVILGISAGITASAILAICILWWYKKKHSGGAQSAQGRRGPQSRRLDRIKLILGAPLPVPADNAQTAPSTSAQPGPSGTQPAPHRAQAGASYLASLAHAVHNK